jgi:hypothetical protein
MNCDYWTSGPGPSRPSPTQAGSPFICDSAILVVQDLQGLQACEKLETRHLKVRSVTFQATLHEMAVSVVGG